VRVLLIGGRWDRYRVELSKTPPRVLVGNEIYDRVDDPDTGEFLGGYARINEENRWQNEGTPTQGPTRPSARRAGRSRRRSLMSWFKGG
jgi:hypothetical protein